VTVVPRAGRHVAANCADVALDSSDLHTETFSNSQGWTLVRVTHVPSGMAAERGRTAELDSPVQAQSECIEELKRALPASPPADVALDLSEPEPAASRPVTRAEFDALAARVRALESSARPASTQEE
jgi:hypothetical protein